MPASVICIKVDYAEATGTHNTQNANFVHKLYKEPIPPQAKEPKCRTTIYGKPILLFHQKSENVNPVFYGKSNMNYDKGAEYVFGFTPEYDVECWEFCNNTSDACNFLGEIPDSWGEDFEARYPEKHKDISRFKIMHDWVVSTKQGAATGNALEAEYTDVDGTVHTHDTAEYRLAKFKTEFESHFDMHYSLIYYVYTFFALMVDQRAKNMFLTYWGSLGKWQPWFYDNDTSFGINNEGQMVLDYYHEDSDQLDNANVYNGQNSTLWVNFREAFPDKIKETYQDLRSNSVLNYDELVDQFITKGSNKWSESVYNEDGDFKYVSMLRSDNDASNLPQVRGTGEEHFRYFIENRLNYCDSKWYAADYADDYAVVRIYTPVDADGNPRTDLAIEANADITVTPYSHMYAGVRYKANGTLYQHRTSANEVYTFEAPNEVFNDTETAIYGASQLSSLGDLAPLYCGYIDVSKATKLVELKVGDGTEGYVNTNLEHLAVGTNRLLKKIDIRNCPDFTGSLGLTGCPNIEEIYATGSGITGVELPDSGYLKIVQLPATISNLTLKNQLYIEELTLQGYGALKTLWLENCPIIDSLTILNNAINLERVRLTNVDWHWDNANVLIALSSRNIGGIDENGSNTEHMWVDGKCHIKNLTGAQLNQLRNLYPYLEITYTTLESQLVYMSDDGLTELHRETITNVGNGTDPVKNGTISTPAKESTAQYHFTYTGWSLTSGGDADSNALLNVEGDRYVYAAYSKAIRSYTVNFYNGSTLLKSVTVEYGSDAIYSGNTPVKDGYTAAEFEFIGWKPEPTNIQGQTDCYAQYFDLRQIADDWATIAANCLNGTATDKYAIGSFKPVEITYEDGTSETIDMEVIAHNHDELVDGVNKWESVSTLPITLEGGRALIYNNELHIMGGQYASSAHYKWNGTEWISASTLPYQLHNNFGAIIYNDEIHVFGGGGGYTNHYKWDGTEWTSVSTLPFSFSCGIVIVYNDEIHLYGGAGANYNHSVWNGTEWSEIDRTSFDANTGTATVYNGNLHIFAYNRYYIYDGTTYSEAESAPGVSSVRIALTYNNEIHIIASPSSGYIHYSWNGTEWKQHGALPISFNGSTAIIHNNEIHILGGSFHSGHRNAHYKWSTTLWKFYETMPYHIGSYGFACELDNKLYCFAGNQHIIWDGTEWTQVGVGNTGAGGDCAQGFVFNNEIYSLNTTHLVKFDGSSFVTVCERPYQATSSKLVVYNGCIHMLSGGQSESLHLHYKWDGSTWTKIEAGPQKNHGFVVYNDKIHEFANGKHYTFDGVEWTQIGTTPFNENLRGNSSAVVYDNKIYVKLGGKRVYEYNGSEWNELYLPDSFTNTSYEKLCCFRGKLHLIGSDNYKGHYIYENPKATLTFMAKNLLKENMKMNEISTNWGDNYGGWEEMNLREYLNDNLRQYLPTDLQSSIKEVNKLSDGGSTNKVIKIVTDNVWIPSCEEVGVTESIQTTGYLKGMGETYQVFTDVASRIRTKVDGTATKYWLRTTNNNYTYTFMSVDTTGKGCSNLVWNGDTGVLIGFCI